MPNLEEENLLLLDNPVWSSLQTKHRKYALGAAEILRYPADMLPFIAFESNKNTIMQDISPFVQKNKKLYIVGDLPFMPLNWSVLARLDCSQMVCHTVKDFFVREELPITGLDNADEMFEFVNHIQPGFFKKKTPLLGSYYGIKINGKLVAMAGERLKTTGYTEISAVCTHPEYTGKGFAQYLITYLCHKIQEAGDIPFLHVLNKNSRAIRLYDFIGFEKRRDISFWQITLCG